MRTKSTGSIVPMAGAKPADILEFEKFQNAPAKKRQELLLFYINNLPLKQQCYLLACAKALTEMARKET
jgi:hypothetical protein